MVERRVADHVEPRRKAPPPQRHSEPAMHMAGRAPFKIEHRRSVPWRRAQHDPPLPPGSGRTPPVAQGCLEALPAQSKRSSPVAPRGSSTRPPNDDQFAAARQIADDAGYTSTQRGRTDWARENPDRQLVTSTATYER